MGYSYNKGNGNIEGSVFNTPEGGVAIHLKNGTGASTVKGTVVSVMTDSGDEYFVRKTAIDGTDAVGVLYESGVGENQDTWVVVDGIADALYGDNEAHQGMYVHAAATADIDAQTAVAEVLHLTVTHECTVDGSVYVSLRGATPVEVALSHDDKYKTVNFGITHECTANGNVSTTLDSVTGAVTTAVTTANGDTPEKVAALIRGTAYTGWTLSGSGANVIAICDTAGPVAGTPAVNVAATGVVATAVTIPVVGATADDDATKVADKIAAATFTGWTQDHTLGVVTFTADDAENKLGDNVFTVGATGVIGAFSIHTEGKNASVVEAGIAVAGDTRPAAGTLIGYALADNTSKVSQGFKTVNKILLKSS